MLCGPASGEGAAPRFYSVWVPLSRAHTINVAAAGGSGGAPPPLPPRTKWTRRVPHPVLIGHAASLTPY